MNGPILKQVSGRSSMKISTSMSLIANEKRFALILLSSLCLIAQTKSGQKQVPQAPSAPVPAPQI